MDKTSKAKAIADILRKEILRGRFDTARKLPSEHQLMRRFSVARETVRGALKELSSRQLVESRPGYGTFLSAHAALRASQCFGVIVPDAFHPFYARIVRGIEEGARKRGWSTLAASLGTGTMRERALKAVEFAELCTRERVSGVFFQPLQFLEEDEKFNRAVLSVFDAARIPAVLLDSDFVPPPNRSAYDMTGSDNTNAGYLLAQHVIAAGAKRLCYFTNPRPAPSSLSRGDGIGLAASEAGLKWTSKSVVVGDATDERLLKALFSGRARPDALLAVNDFVASFLMETLARLGINVSRDVLLAGFNDDETASRMSPPLTTMAQPCHAIGLEAVELMARRLLLPDAPAARVLLQTTLVRRASTVFAT